MSLYPMGSLSSNYQTRGQVRDGDCLVGSEFGFRYDDPGLSNEALAEYIVEEFGDSDIDIFLPDKIADALANNPNAPNPTGVYEGGRTSYYGRKGKATAGELDSALELMARYNRRRPIIIAHARHVARVALQFEMIGANPIVPDGLPDVFDRYSQQSWTRGPLRWVAREAQVVPYMRFITKEI